MRHRHAPVKWDCPLLVPELRRDELAKPSMRLEMQVAKQLELAARYTRLARRTGLARFRIIASCEANTAERLMKGI